MAQFAKLSKWHGDKARWVLDAWTQVWLASEFVSWNLAPYLVKVKCPVLVIHGELDEFGSVAFTQCIITGVGHPYSKLVLLE